MSEETKLMPEPEAKNTMEWGTAVQVIDWCVNEVLCTLHEWPEDFEEGQADKVMEAWERILRG
jgi:hypothetical protein|tara:strand:+ start:2182 stop:2370 length:189 start_codon:yes stop_codon:yes gene_type:complete